MHIFNLHLTVKKCSIKAEKLNNVNCYARLAGKIGSLIKGQCVTLQWKQIMTFIKNVTSSGIH